jgi:hypothetical protein
VEDRGVLSRRHLIAALGGAVATSGAVALLAHRGGRPASGRSSASRTALPPPSGATPRDDLEVREWRFGTRRALALIPKGLAPGVRLPLLVALHGRGEADDARTGSRAWLDHYDLATAYRAVRTPPFDRKAIGRHAREERLVEIEAALGARPFEGLVVACPSLEPDLGGLGYEGYARFLESELLPKLRAETPILGTARTTGIDGVSLGGITALRIGAARPDLFHAIGGLQPAILETTSEGPVHEALAKGLADRPLRLLTTDDDGYRPQVLATSKALEQRGIAHTLIVDGGVHDVAFLRAIGGIEMLYFHDRALRA